MAWPESFCLFLAGSLDCKTSLLLSHRTYKLELVAGIAREQHPFWLSFLSSREAESVRLESRPLQDPGCATKATASAQLPRLTGNSKGSQRKWLWGVIKKKKKEKRKINLYLCWTCQDLPSYIYIYDFGHWKPVDKQLLFFKVFWVKKNRSNDDKNSYILTEQTWLTSRCLGLCLCTVRECGLRIGGGATSHSLMNIFGLICILMGIWISGQLIPLLHLNKILPLFSWDKWTNW